MLAKDIDAGETTLSGDKAAIISAAMDGIRTIEKLTGFPEVDAETADFYAQSAILGIEAHGYRIVSVGDPGEA